MSQGEGASINYSEAAVENMQAENQNDPFHDLDNIMQQNIQNGNEIYMNQQQNQITSFNNRIQQLQQKQQILKYSVADHQQSVKQLYMRLYTQKKRLLQLCSQQYNKKAMKLDIGILEEFKQMRKRIQNQQSKIIKLKSEIDLQGMNVLNNQRNIIILRQKRQDIEKQIESGRRFAASQYVRDYLERTYIHKVSYEDVKYQYEMKTKLKQYLKNQKEAYQKKKEELKKAIQKQGATKKDLEEEKAALQRTSSIKISKQTPGINGK